MLATQLAARTSRSRRCTRLRRKYRVDRAIGKFAPSKPNTAAFLMCIALAAFGADFTLSPSWNVCSDIGGSKTATISGAMNMIESMGGFASAVAYTYFSGLTGKVQTFFYLAALLNVAAIICWTRIDPRRKLSEPSNAGQPVSDAATLKSGFLSVIPFCPMILPTL